MKQALYKWIFLFIAGGLAFTSCNDDENSDASSLFVSDFYPAIVMEGTELTVVGSALTDVTEVVFPGDKISTTITHIDDNTLKVTVPADLNQEAASLIVKTENQEVSSRQSIRLAQPKFSMYLFSSNEGAQTNTNITISGQDLLLVEKVMFAKGNKQTVVDAIHMTRKSNDAIKLVIPNDAPIDNEVAVTLLFKNQAQMTLPPIDITEGTGEGGDESLTDPITPETIMLNDFEEHDGHNSSWDHSWTDSEATEFLVDEETGNTYLYHCKPFGKDGGWMVNCNHVDNGTVSNVENYVFKFDIKIDSGVTGASEASMQIVFADNWLWVGTGLFPETTDGKWITVSRNISDLKSDLTGDLVIGKNNNGLYGNNIPAGICIDNLRLDPK